MTQSITGACLCGKVKIRAEASPKLLACHCSTCRHRAGGPLLGIEAKAVSQIEGEQHITIFNSSEWAERGLCRECGSHLFYRLKESDAYSLCAGLFELPDVFALESQFFIEQKPDFYEFANNTRKLTGEEVFKLYGG